MLKICLFKKKKKQFKCKYTYLGVSISLYWSFSNLAGATNDMGITILSMS